MLENPRKFKNSPNLSVLFVKITKFLEISKKITIKTIVFSNSDQVQCSSFGKRNSNTIVCAQIPHVQIADVQIKGHFVII